MKILIDGRFYGLEHAGLGRYTIELINNLQKLDEVNKYSVLLRKDHFNRMKWPKNWKPILADYRHYSIDEQRYLPKLIEENDPDFIHFLHFNVPIITKRPYIVTIHDLLMHKSQGKKATTLSKPLYYIKRFGYHVVFSKAVKGASKLIVPSETVSDEVIKYYKISEKKVKVIYEGIDQNFFRDRSKKIDPQYAYDFPYFIYVGNAYPHKNLERLIEALTRLRNNKVKLVIVTSKGPFRERLKKMVGRVYANQRVVFTEFVPDDDLVVLLKRSVAFVFPSLSEGFGLPGLEALASGTLLLASQIDVFKEVYKDKAIYFNPYDFSSIAQAMDQALSMDKEKRGRKIIEGEKLAKTYSWQKMAQETLEVYNNLK